MKTYLFLMAIITLSYSCKTNNSVKDLEEEILKTEKDFEKMAGEKGIAEAFYFFADKEAVIKRQNDTLIKGKEDILTYYKKRDQPGIQLSWAPDYIYVAENGDLAYTYGKYEWRISKPDGESELFQGIFHTVWKKQQDGTWKYVWD